MTINITSLAITDEEFAARSQELQQHLQATNQAGVVLFDRDYIQYYSGFAFIPTERPIAFVMNRDGERALFVPRLEVEHAQSLGNISTVAHYLEYPTKNHPEAVLHTLMGDMGITSSVAADMDGYPWIFGYRGQTLTEMGYTVHPIRAFIEDQMMIKSEAEIACLKESCKWGNLAHVLLQRYTVVGATETAVTQRACDEATKAMFDAIGPIYRGQNGDMEPGAYAGYRGQIGRNASIPHAMANNITFQAGDVLVTGASAPVWGYVSELERTMFLGVPSDEQKRLYDHMMALQTMGIEALEPGRPCSSVDDMVQAYCREHDLMDNWRHHVGHAIGLRYHEGPFLDLGDDTIMQPGMVFTVEPGLYSPELGGYRHSDTVVITEDGHEMITFYPRDLESMIIPI